MKNSNDPIGNWTRDFLACSGVPQWNSLPRTLQPGCWPWQCRGMTGLLSCQVNHLNIPVDMWSEPASCPWAFRLSPCLPADPVWCQQEWSGYSGNDAAPQGTTANIHSILILARSLAFNLALQDSDNGIKLTGIIFFAALKTRQRMKSKRKKIYTLIKFNYFKKTRRLTGVRVCVYVCVCSNSLGKFCSKHFLFW